MGNFVSFKGKAVCPSHLDSADDDNRKVEKVPVVPHVANEAKSDHLNIKKRRVKEGGANPSLVVWLAVSQGILR